jgi:hypothetical protein
MTFSSGEARAQLSGTRVATTVARVAFFFSICKAKDLTVMPCELVVTSRRLLSCGRAPSRDPSLFCHAVGAVITPRALAPFSRILVISPLNSGCSRRERRRHVVMIAGAWRGIFEQHELFQEIETNDPTVDLEVATIDAGSDDTEIDD